MLPNAMLLLSTVARRESPPSRLFCSSALVTPSPHTRLFPPLTMPPPTARAKPSPHALPKKHQATIRCPNKYIWHIFSYFLFFCLFFLFWLQMFWCAGFCIFPPPACYLRLTLHGQPTVLCLQCFVYPCLVVCGHRARISRQ